VALPAQRRNSRRVRMIEHLVYAPSKD